MFRYLHATKSFVELRIMTGTDLFFFLEEKNACYWEREFWTTTKTLLVEGSASTVFARFRKSSSLNKNEITDHLQVDPSQRQRTSSRQRKLSLTIKRDIGGQQHDGHLAFFLLTKVNPV